MLTTIQRTDEDGEPIHIGPVTARRVDELDVGTQWWTPANRWETATKITTDAGWAVRIETDAVAAGYSWSLPGNRVVASVSMVYLSDMRRVVVSESSSFVTAELVTGYGRGDHILAQAIAIRGKGWHMNERPDGGDVVQSLIKSKAAARTAVTRAAKRHAKALGVTFGGAR